MPNCSRVIIKNNQTQDLQYFFRSQLTKNKLAILAIKVEILSFKTIKVN